MATKKKYQYIETPTEKPKFGSLPTKATYDTTKWDETAKGQTALNEYNTAKNAVTGYNDFAFSQQGWLDNVLGKIKNYGDFSYDLNGDALYQQYKDKYIQQGKMAMADTMGQAAAMTGGYGNSYAQSVGQQVYQGELQKLNDIVPQLYQLALDRYNMGKEDLYNQYGLASSERQNEYGMYQDKYGRLVDANDILSDAYYNGANLHQSEQSAANSAAGKAFDDAMALWGADTSQKWDEWNANESLRQYGNSEWWKGEQWEYGKERDAMSDSRELAMTLISRGIAVPSDIAASSGLSDNAITALQEAYQKTTAAGGTSVNDLTKISDTTLDLLENFGVETATAYASMMVANGYIDETQLADILDLANSSINGGEYPDGADVTVEGYGETTPETQQKTEAEEEEEEKKKKNPATTGGGGGTSIKATHKSD